MKTEVFRLAVALSATAAVTALTPGGAATRVASAQGRAAQSVAVAASGELDVVSVDGIEVVRVQGNVHMIVGAGPNLAASIGDEGVLLVDTGAAATSEKVIAAMRRMSPRAPIQYILDTQFKADHTGGTEAIAKVGRRLKDESSTQAAVLAHENVLNRMSASTGQASPRPVAAWPTDTFFGRTKEVYFNAEPVVMYHRPALTDGDSFVYFRKSDVIVAGDIYMTTFPHIDVAAGGHIDGVIEGLNDILEISIPANNVEDGTLVIPGHGRISDEYDVAVYRDMLTIIRDRVQDAIKRGQTVAQVKADKRITLEYENRHGATSGPWTTEMFLEAIYLNLTTK